MKINKIIAAAMSIAIVGGTLPYIGIISPETVITVSAAEESAFAGVKITNSENADIYNGDKSKSFKNCGRTYYNGVILNGKDNKKAFVEFDVSDADTFSCSARDLQTYLISNTDCLDVYVDDVLSENWSFSKEHNVSKNSKIRIEAADTGRNIVICDITTDKGSSEPPVIPEYKNDTDFMKSSFLNQLADIYTGEDKDKFFIVDGRTYFSGIVLNAQGGNKYDSVENTAYISFNVENIDKLKFSYGRVVNDDLGADTKIDILDDNNRNMSTELIYSSGKSEPNNGLHIEGYGHIIQCEIDVSKTNTITFKYNNPYKDSYAIFDISVDGKPIEHECIIPEYNSTADFLKSAFRSDNADIYTGEEKDNTFTVDEKTYDQGIVLSDSETWENTHIQFNVENLDKVSFTLRKIKDESRTAEPGFYDSKLSLLRASDSEDNFLLDYPDLDLSEPKKCDLDVSDISVLSITASELDNYDGKLAITDIEITPKGTKANETSTTASATTSVTSSTTSTQTTNDIVYGDANCDGNADLADAVLIMQALANPAKYKLTSNGKINADCSNVGDGITNKDALAIQKYTLNLIESLPEKN